MVLGVRGCTRFYEVVRGCMKLYEVVQGGMKLYKVVRGYLLLISTNYILYGKIQSIKTNSVSKLSHIAINCYSK